MFCNASQGMRAGAVAIKSENPGPTDIFLVYGNPGDQRVHLKGRCISGSILTNIGGCI